MSFSRAHRLLFSSPSLTSPVRYLGYAASSRLRHLRGQNLSERFQRLERSLKGKKELSKELDQLSAQVTGATAASPPESGSERFHGFLVPKEPWPPRDDECCMSNCAICVYDLYEESLEAYREAVAKLRSSLSALNIPETEWPPNIRSSNNQESRSRKDVVLSAFEEMERALMKKRESQAASADSTTASR